MMEVRCPKCNLKAAEASSESKLTIVCKRCKTPYYFDRGKIAPYQDRLQLVKKLHIGK